MERQTHTKNTDKMLSRICASIATTLSLLLRMMFLLIGTVSDLFIYLYNSLLPTVLIVIFYPENKPIAKQFMLNWKLCVIFALYGL